MKTAGIAAVAAILAFILGVAVGNAGASDAEVTTEPAPTETIEVEVAPMSCLDTLVAADERWENVIEAWGLASERVNQLGRDLEDETFNGGHDFDRYITESAQYIEDLEVLTEGLENIDYLTPHDECLSHY